MSLPAMSLGDGFCVRRKDDMGEEGGWVHPNGENSMAISDWSWVKEMLGPPIPAFKVYILAGAG